MSDESDDMSVENDVDDEHLHWNSVDGWKEVEKSCEKFIRCISNHGHVCSICGEKRKDVTEIEDKVLVEWCAINDELDINEQLYAQFPKEREINENVSYMLLFNVIFSSTTFMFAKDVLMKARKDWNPSKWTKTHL
jgi:hypothetical protein